ncbi:MAG: hypothetical protein SOZ59_04730 [Candidatus Limivivens sp.]|nr:hypothetical protein [Candidatus Limivivens sp.]
MGAVVLLLGFLAVGGMGFFFMRKLDGFLEENRCRQETDSVNGGEILRLACENPMMLASVTGAVEKAAEEFRETSFYFYTGGREELQKMLENERVDVILLMEEPEEMRQNVQKYGKIGGYERRKSFFIPAALTEPSTGLRIEPIENHRRVMYILWNERTISEKQRRLLASVLTTCNLW